MELLSDGKYIVFKVGEFEKLLSDFRITDFHSPSVIEDIVNSYAVPDGTTIRAQDIFAAPALYAYSNAIRVATMVMRNSNSVDPAQIKRLDDLAEFFGQRADETAENEFRSCLINISE